MGYKEVRCIQRFIVLFTIFALSTGSQLTGINIGDAGIQNPPWIIDFSLSFFFSLPVFPILIMCTLGTSR